MPELSFSRKNIAVIILIILLVVAGIATIRFISGEGTVLTPTPSVDDIQASSGAINGTEAFFSVDYQAGQETWLNRFCATSTEAGCLLVKSGAAGLWKSYRDNKLVTSAKVVSQTRIKQTPNEQVWRVSIQLTNPFPGSEKKSDEAYVVVTRVKDIWKFDRFLMSEEIKALGLNNTEGAKQ